MIPLSHVIIVGYVNKNTPWCVLQEISTSLFKGNLENIPTPAVLNNIIHKINTYKPPIVSNPPHGHEYSLIARFINRSASWELKELITAFQFLLPFMNHATNVQLPQCGDFVIGYITPRYPTSYTPCILYRLCQQLNIPTCFDTPLELMALAVKSVVTKFGDIRVTLKHCIREAPRNILIKMITCCTPALLGGSFMDYVPLITPKYCDSVSVQDPITFEGLLRAYKGFINKNKTGNHTPTTQCEAVVVAALQYKIDLSTAAYPLDAFYSLGACGDRFFSLEKNFNPNLPMELYEEATLRKLAQYEGFGEQEIRIQSKYELLQLASLMPTFYLPFFSCNNKKEGETYIYKENVNEMPSDCLICYGIKAEQQKNSVFFTFRELGDLFLHNKNFIDPTNTSKCFESRVIYKLKNIAATEEDSKGSTEGKQGRRHLLYAITQVELFTENTHQEILKLNQAYQKSLAETKKRFEKVAQELFYFSMALRGWMGDEDYPITVAPVDNQDMVDIKVSQTLDILLTTAAELKAQSGFDFLLLPLLLYRNGKFIPSSSKAQGFTLQDRIRIIDENKDKDDDEACIRRSSNWFASSSYRYMQVIGLRPPFQIEEMREIS